MPTLEHQFSPCKRQEILEPFGKLFRLGGPMSEARRRHALGVEAIENTGVNLLREDGQSELHLKYNVGPRELRISVGQLALVSPVSLNDCLLQCLREKFPQDLEIIMRGEPHANAIETNFS